MDNIFPAIDKEKIAELHKSIGQNIKRNREKKGMSQLELAILMGHKSPSFITNCENSKNKHFNLEHLYLIANILEVDLCELVKFDLDKS